jgi:hypothetical protein
MLAFRVIPNVQNSHIDIQWSLFRLQHWPFFRLLQASGLGHISHQLREIFIDKWFKSGAMRLALA